MMSKTNYRALAMHVPVEAIDVEVSEKLDAIVAVAQQARPTHLTRPSVRPYMRSAARSGR